MRVVITKPNGEKLTVTGSPEEIAALLRAREEKPATYVPQPVYIPYVRPAPWRWWDGAPVEPYITWTASAAELNLSPGGGTASAFTLTEVS